MLVSSFVGLSIYAHICRSILAYVGFLRRDTISSWHEVFGRPSGAIHYCVVPKCETSYFFAQLDELAFFHATFGKFAKRFHV